MIEPPPAAAGPRRFYYVSGSTRYGFSFRATDRGTAVVSGTGTAFPDDESRANAEALLARGYLARAGRDEDGRDTYEITFAGLLALSPTLQSDLSRVN